MNNLLSVYLYYLSLIICINRARLGENHAYKNPAPLQVTCGKEVGVTPWPTENVTRMASFKPS